MAGRGGVGRGAPRPWVRGGRVRGQQGLGAAERGWQGGPRRLFSVFCGRGRVGGGADQVKSFLQKTLKTSFVKSSVQAAQNGPRFFGGLGGGPSRTCYANGGKMHCELIVWAHLLVGNKIVRLLSCWREFLSRAQSYHNWRNVQTGLKLQLLSVLI